MGEGGAHVVAATTFQGRETIAWITAGAIRWPDRCACCGAPPEGTARLESGPSVVGEYPICAGCRRHAAMDTRVVVLSAVLAIAAVGSAYCGGWGITLGRRVGATVMVLLVCLVLAYLGFAWLLSRMLCRVGMDCPDSGWPVEVRTVAGSSAVLGTGSERSDERELRAWSEAKVKEAGDGGLCLSFRSPAYAADFLAAHGGDPAATGHIEMRM